MGAVPISFGFRVDTRRSNCTDRLGDIIRAKSSSQDYGRLDGLYDAAADRPIVDHAKRTDLAVGFSMTVQEQEISDALVAVSNSDARLVHDGNASHQEHTR